jgi:acetylornithine/succinyldiaminopimelate/putrescine aminotransferase
MPVLDKKYDRIQFQAEQLLRLGYDTGTLSVLYTHWHTLLIIPPLIINEAQLVEGFNVIDKALILADKAVVV